MEERKMADEKKRMGRRGLLALFGITPEEPGSAASTFRLAAFYRARERAPSSDALPPFTLREGLPNASELSTTVGVPELARGRKRNEPE
jgi:hypothetical protein